MAQLHTLVDTFSGTSLGASWTSSGSVVVNDTLLLTGTPSVDALVQSVSTYTLVDSYAHIKIVDPGTPALGFVYPLLLQSASLNVYWSLNGGFINAGWDTPSSSGTIYSTFYSSTYLYVRITEYAGVVYWDTSSNGSTWVNRGYNETLGTLPNFRVNFQVSTPYLTTQLTLDNFNSTSTTRYRTVSGSWLYSGSVARPEVERHRTVSGTISFSGIATATKQTVYTDTERKTYLYKVYDSSNNYVGLWNDVIDEFNFTEELNTAGSAVSLTLARNSDTRITSVGNLQDQTGANILDQTSAVITTSVDSPNQVGAGSNVDYNLRVDVYVFYGHSESIQDQNGFDILDQAFDPITGSVGAPNGARIYSGFISDISSRYGSTETTVVTLMTFGWDLDQYPVSSGSSTTVAFSSTDPSQIIKTGITSFQTASGSAISWTSSTVATTGTTVSYTFKANTYLELLKKALELAPSNWYFYLDQGTQLINFKGESATPDHYLHLGKHIESLDLRGNIENVVNDVLFIGGETAGVSLYDRTTVAPSSKTRRSLRRLSDSRVTDLTTSSLLSNSEISRNNQILYRSTLSVLDKNYDIESIKLGQMIGFRNFGNYIDSLQLQVVGKSYTPEAVELQLGTLLPQITKRVSDIKRNLEAQESEFVPATPS